ncbi:MAG TPA: cytochrome c oxidase subunit II [Acidimicrobiia bacterium]|jgi:cytochrome c oxidase subunit 2
MRKPTIRRGKPTKLTAIAVLCVLVAAGCSSATHAQSTLHPAGKIARDDLNIFTAFFIIAAIIGVGVILGVIYAAVRFRERPGNENPVQIHGNTTLEISWTIAPALILMVMAVFTVKLIWEQAAQPKNAMQITVTGKQWFWDFQYTNVDSSHQVFTSNELHIPEGVPVWFTLKSDNVIHSFWIPALAGKRDVVPGHLNHFQLIADKDLATDGHPKEFFGQCVEYCGLSHADMRNRTFVETQSDFNKWYQSQLQPWTQTQVSTFNKLTSVYSCTSCHYIQGETPGNDAKVEKGTLDPGTAYRGPSLTHLADRTSFGGATFTLNFDNLWQWIWDAPRHSTSDFGKYNECPERGKGGSIIPTSSPCKVGMPSFKNDPVKPMSKQTAQDIARFLLSTKNFTGQ